MVEFTLQLTQTFDFNDSQNPEVMSRLILCLPLKKHSVGVKKSIFLEFRAKN